MLSVCCRRVFIHGGCIELYSVRARHILARVGCLGMHGMRSRHLLFRGRLELRGMPRRHLQLRRLTWMLELRRGRLLQLALVLLQALADAHVGPA